MDGELGNRPRPRCYCPLGTGDWYYALHAQTMDAVARLERNTENKEIKASIVDFTMLGNLALYHAYMVQAAYHLSMYDKTNDKKFLTPSYEAMYQAREAFAVISDLGERYYARNLELDSGDSTKRNGNWRDRLVNQVDRDLQDMESLLMKNGISPEPPKERRYHSIAPASPYPMIFSDDVPARCKPGENLPLSLSTGFRQGLKPGETPVVHYRTANMREGIFKQIRMEWHNHSFKAVIPGDCITPAYNLCVYFTYEDLNENIHIYPGIYNPNSNMPYFIVNTMEEMRDST